MTDQPAQVSRGPFHGTSPGGGDHRVATIGLLEAIYLTYVHYHGLKGLLCIGGHSGHSSCETVQSSVYSKVAGIPVALLGLLGYIALLGSLMIRGELGRALGSPVGAAVDRMTEAFFLLS